MTATHAGYSTTLLDHYRRPRNLGDLADAGAVALVREESCGDILRLAVRLEDGRVVAARFKAYGCAASIAAGSVLTELLIGRSLEEMASVADEDIVRALGGLPASRLHVAGLARQAAATIVARLREA